MVLSWTVLGGSPAWPNPGQAASGYLLESEERRMLIDCGSGIAAGAARGRPAAADRHPDQRTSTPTTGSTWCRCTMPSATAAGTTGPSRCCTCRPAAAAVLDTVASVWDGSVETFEAAFDLIEYDPHDDLRLGDLQHHVRAVPALHHLLLDQDRDAIGGDRVTRPTPRPTETAGALRPRRRPVRVRGVAGRCRRTTPASAVTWTRPRPGARPAGRRQAAAAHPRAGRGDRLRLRARAGRAEYKGPIDLAMPGLRIDV